MKIAIYGQYYQNSTEPIIKDIFKFLNNSAVDLFIEANFLEILYEKKLPTGFFGKRPKRQHRGISEIGSRKKVHHF